jgi:hypothetical protein
MNEITAPHKIVINVDKNSYARNYDDDFSDFLSEKEKIQEFKRLIF